MNPFLATADAAALAVIATLLTMSIASWSIALLKALRHLGGRAHKRRFLALYRRSPTPAALEQELRAVDDGGMSRLARAAFAAKERWQARTTEADTAAAAADEQLELALHRALGRERMRIESGLTTLAAVASTAPFVGLFGTVWGIYHALLAIGFSGQASLDKVAGPVGEALVMTAIGLAVAIPAALAYNALVRANRVRLGRLEDFALELQAFLATGVHDPRAATEH